MTLSELRNLFSPTRWAIVGAIVLIAVCAILYVLFAWRSSSQDAAEAKVAGAYSAAGASSAKDALKTAGEANRRETDIDQATKEAEDEIRAAAPDDQYGVALRAHCGLPESRRDPACAKLRRSDP